MQPTRTARRYGTGALLIAASMSVSGAHASALADPAASSAPTSASVIAGDVSAQLAPPDSALTVAIELETGGYHLPFRPPTPCAVIIRWYHGSYTMPPSARAHSVLIAGGRTTFGRSHLSQVTIRAAALGRRLIRHSRSLTVTAIVAYTATRRPTILASRQFRL